MVCCVVVYCLLSVAVRRLLCVACYVLFVGGWSLLVVRCLLYVDRCSSCVVCRLMRFDRCVSFVVRCLLCVVLWLLFIVCSSVRA